MYDGQSILIPRKGTLNNIFYKHEKFWTVDTMFWSKINDRKVNSKFLYYNVKDLDWMGMNVGSAVPSLTVPVINDVDVYLPQLPEQKAIAEVLSSLDDKIDLLHRQNKTLESLTETLFRHWVGNKRFDGKLNEIVNFQSGFAYKGSDFAESGNFRIIKIKNISGDVVDIKNSDFVSDNVGDSISTRFLIKSGDILFAMTGAEIGKLGIVPGNDGKLLLNQRVGLLKEKVDGSNFLAYLHLKSEYGIDYVTATATGSAQPNISASYVLDCPFPKLDDTDLRVYSKQLAQIYSKVVFNFGQIQKIEKLRDTLLPKLMSGDVRVDYEAAA